MHWLKCLDEECIGELYRNNECIRTNRHTCTYCMYMYMNMIIMHVHVLGLHVRTCVHTSYMHSCTHPYIDVCIYALHAHLNVLGLQSKAHYAVSLIKLFDSIRLRGGVCLVSKK